MECELMIFPALEKKFKERETKVIELIHSYGIQYKALGIFGSYARGDYTGASDIDFFLVCDKPSTLVSGNLREEADMLKADIVFITEETLRNGESLLAQNIRKDMKLLEGKITGIEVN